MFPFTITFRHFKTDWSCLFVLNLISLWRVGSWTWRVVGRWPNQNLIHKMFGLFGFWTNFTSLIAFLKIALVFPPFQLLLIRFFPGLFGWELGIDPTQYFSYLWIGYVGMGVALWPSHMFFWGLWGNTNTLHCPWQKSTLALRVTHKSKICCHI